MYNRSGKRAGCIIGGRVIVESYPMVSGGCRKGGELKGILYIPFPLSPPYSPPYRNLLSLAISSAEDLEDLVD